VKPKELALCVAASLKAYCFVVTSDSSRNGFRVRTKLKMTSLSPAAAEAWEKHTGKPLKEVEKKADIEFIFHFIDHYVGIKMLNPRAYLNFLRYQFQAKHPLSKANDLEEWAIQWDNFTPESALEEQKSL
tara:strand:- start:1104 stop:1493 length:390 start_codon:yes stop_codon:yes gene_type:complete